MSGAESLAQSQKRTRQVTQEVDLTSDSDDADDDTSFGAGAPAATSTPGTAKPADAAQDGEEGLEDPHSEEDEEEETRQYRDVAAKATNKWVLLVTLADGGKLSQGRVKDKQDPSKSKAGSWDAFRTGLMTLVASGKFGNFPAVSFAFNRGKGVIFPQSKADQETLWKACKALVVPDYRYSVKKQSSADPMVQGSMRVEGWILEFVPNSERWLTGIVTLNQPPNVEASHKLPTTKKDRQTGEDVPLPPMTTLAWKDDRDKATKRATGAKVFSFLMPPEVAYFIRDGAPRGRIKTYGGNKVVYHRGKPLVPGNEIKHYTPGNPSKAGGGSANR